MASGLFPRRTLGSPFPRLSSVFSLTIPGEFLKSAELPSTAFLQKIEIAVSGFAVPPAQPVPLPPALLAARFVFVREDASIPPLSPLYHGPYLVLERRTTFFRLPIGD